VKWDGFGCREGGLALAEGFGQGGVGLREGVEFVGEVVEGAGAGEQGSQREMICGVIAAG